MVDQAKTTLGAVYLRELDSEAKATRECLANVPMDDPGWKPHDRSMELGYLAVLTADMPRWIQIMIEEGVIDFATWEQFNAKTADELVQHFDQGIEKACKSISQATEETLKKQFVLKNQDQILMQEPIGETISSTINHMVHHRGQLSVYLRMNNKPVPSIYGPSADSGGF